MEKILKTGFLLGMFVTQSIWAESKKIEVEYQVPTLQEADQILAKSLSYASKNETEKSRLQNSVRDILKMECAKAGEKAFYKLIESRWDARLKRSEKQELLEKAALLAKEAALKRLTELRQLKASQIMGRFTLDVTDVYHHRENFFSEDGEVDLSPSTIEDLDESAEFRRKRAELEKSPEYQAELEKRTKAAKRLEDAQSFSKLRIHSGSSHSGACGTPSTDAPTLRPEGNGRF